jgi:ascorbate-specific PTS system EIIC-type component UlaA
VTPGIKFGLIGLIILSAGAAVFVSVLISRRQDLPSAARRVFLLSNVSLIFCLAAAIAGISIYSRAHFWGDALLVLAAIFLVLKFVLVRRFAHLIRSRERSAASSAVSRAVGKRT